MALEGLHHITAITADAPAQRRLLRARARPAPGQEDGQLRPARRLPPVLRRRARHARLDPDLLRVPGRRPGPGRRRHGPHHPVARRLRRGARLLGRAPGRRGRRHRAHRGRRAARSPTSRACATSCSPSPSTTPRWPPTPPTSRPSTRCWASTACAPTPSRPDASTALLEAIGFAHDGGADWTLRGDERHAALRYDAPPGARGVTSAGTVHHVAWSAADDAELEAVRAQAVAAGARATEIIDRQYFHSVYFREPSGVLFELASRDIGFEYDEPLESLGEALEAAAAVRGAPRASSSRR